MKKNYYLMNLLVIVWIFPGATIANENNQKTQVSYISKANVLSTKDELNTQLSFNDLVKEATNHKIKIINYNPKVNKEFFLVSKTVLQNKDKFLSFIKQKFDSIYSTSTSGQEIIYLLPKGVNQIEIAKKALKKVDARKLFLNIPKSKQPIKQKIETIPEVIALRKLADNEKTKQLHFERYINPGSLSSVYSFDVAYNPRVGSMTPFLKNGEEVKGKMEGYTSFSSISDFVNHHTDSLKAYRLNGSVFLQLAGDEESQMMLRGTDANMLVASRSRIPNGPHLDLTLEGNAEQIISVAKVFLDKGQLTMVDVGAVK